AADGSCLQQGESSFTIACCSESDLVLATGTARLRAASWRRNRRGWTRKSKLKIDVPSVNIDLLIRSAAGVRTRLRRHRCFDVTSREAKHLLPFTCVRARHYVGDDSAST